MKQDLKKALPKVRNPPSFTLRKEKTKEASRNGPLVTAVVMKSEFYF